MLDSVYVGLIDWGRSCLHGTLKCYPSLSSSDSNAIEVAQRKRPHVAPECFSATPPMWYLSQDIYSMSYQMKTLLMAWKAYNEIPHSLQSVVIHILQLCKQGMNIDPTKKPFSSEFCLVFERTLKIHPLSGIHT